MRNLRVIAVLLSLSACVCRFDSLRRNEPPPLPRLSNQLSLDGNLEAFSCDSAYGETVSDGPGSISAGFGRRDQVLSAFGPPPAISWESGREMWCYRLPANKQGQRLHLTVCYEGWLGLDELYGFTLGKSKWVVFDEANSNPSPPADVWKI